MILKTNEDKGGMIMKGLRFVVMAMLFLSVLLSCGGGSGENIGAAEEATDTPASSNLPNVTAVFPLNGSTVAITTKISPFFSNKMDIRSFTPDTFKVVSENTNEVVAGKYWLGESTQVHFRPNNLLIPKTRYRVTIQGAKDADGNIMTEAYSWTFTTADNVVTVALSATPQNAIFYSHGGDDQATYSADQNIGTAEVKTVGNPWDVSLRWLPLNIEALTTYRVAFSCQSAPSANIQVELKKANNPTNSYVTATASCEETVIIDLVSGISDPEGRVNVNIGDHIGTYIIGPIMVLKIE